jgi:phosphohistidine phosphatase
MKILYLVRHAKSSWKFPDLDDFERPLNKRGNRDAPVMGRFLNEREILPDIIISSPAKRAKKTAKIISDVLTYPKNRINYDEGIYEASTMGLLKITSTIDDSCKSAMLVGHNPSMTYFANMLANFRIGNIPTCGIVCIDLNISSWKKLSENSGKLAFFEFPKNLISL